MSGKRLTSAVDPCCVASVLRDQYMVAGVPFLASRYPLAAVGRRVCLFSNLDPSLNRAARASNLPADFAGIEFAVNSLGCVAMGINIAAVLRIASALCEIVVNSLKLSHLRPSMS